MTNGTKKPGTSGGYAAKMGDLYELIWAVDYALQCIQDERRSITYEDPDPYLADGSEFTYVDEHKTTHVFQVKRQRSNSSKWTIDALKKMGIFEAARSHVDGGREYYFGSMTPCGNLRDLSERVRKSSNLDNFKQHLLVKGLKPEFKKLTDIFDTEEKAWQMLRHMHFSVMDETQYRKVIITLAEATLAGAEGSVLYYTVGSVLLENLKKPLTKNELIDALKQKRIFVPEEKDKQTARDEVRAATKRWQDTIQQELLDPEIPRDETIELMHQLSSARLHFIVGDAGSGKSTVVNQVVKELQCKNAEILAFRLDRCTDFNSTKKLGEQLDLAKSPVASLYQAANGRDAFLVIDQLDAISRVSGRLPNSYDAVADLIEGAKLFKNIRVIVVCRLFDIEHDKRICDISEKKETSRIIVRALPDDVVASVVKGMGGDITKLTEKQQELLKLPLYLVLFKAIIEQPHEYDFVTSVSLFDAFWDQKRDHCIEAYPRLRFNDTLGLIAKVMSDKQVLTISDRKLDHKDYIMDARILASENLLAIADHHVSFFHEEFFDYVFVRQWLSKEQTLVDFLCAQEQRLFRRAQVKQILEAFLAEEDFERFREEIEELLLEKKIRTHIKAIAIVIFGSISSPKDEDLDLALRIKDNNPKLGQLLWLKLAGCNWFGLLYDRGLIQEWFDSDDPERQWLAHTSLCNAMVNHDKITIKFLTERYDLSKDSEQVLQFIPLEEIYESRSLFELLLDVARSGGFSLDNEWWISLGDLAQREPSWMLELLDACLESALKSKNDTGITVLGYHNDGFNESIEQLVKSEPQLFLAKIIPYLLDAIRKIEKESISYETQLSKVYLNFPFPSNEGTDDVGMALYNGTAHALAKLASTSPEEIELLLHKLADDKHVSTQALLFHAFKANPEYFADLAAELILENHDRLQCGDASGDNLISREVVQAIAPYVYSKFHESLEDKFRDLHVVREKDSYREWYRAERGKRLYKGKPLPGHTAFKFLSALDCDKLSPLGTRRLAEYERKFSSEVLSPPTGITGGVVGPPIRLEAAAKMSDRQWFLAMKKYHKERASFGLVGGAYELSMLLKRFTVDDPLRFAGLAIKMTPKMNPVYPSAILWGFSEANISDNAKPVVFEAIRRITNLGLGECDKYLGWSLRHLAEDVPIDLVEKVIDRALCSFRSKSDLSNNISPNRDLEFEGINTTRGSLAYSLANLLSYDKDGTRTAKVTPHLVKWASDPVLGVRTCVAHIIGACLQHEPSRAYEAFDQLIDTDDILLTTRSVERLILYIGNAVPEKIDPVVDRMLKSEEPKVREAGGSIAVFAACHWNRSQLMERVLAADVDIRKGAAESCVKMISASQESKLVLDALHKLMNDENDEVLKKVGEITGVLGGHQLRQFADLFKELIESPVYSHITSQLLFSLKEATDKVDDLIECALRRFVEINAGDVAGMQAHAFRGGYYASDLVIRGLAQAKNKKRISALLDILDHLVEMNVYGINEKIERIERH
ncbi:ATP-binding protein [Corynebacterium matruchotii]|uniref:ATP-binding protein n=1 Tax=Corynebacterium matruchotii TaxID=43768 RepID=UPI0028E32006|nr:ATP-binding protein [Corynebacterium matruchotii]